MTALVVVVFPAFGARAEPRGREDCPSLFASDRPHDPRGDVVLRRTPHAIDLSSHHERWSAPRPVRIHGLRPLRSHKSAGTRRAVVELSGALGELCPAKRYTIEAGDALGARARVVAVLREGLLVEENETLWFVAISNQTMPAFRMIWHATWSMRLPQRAAPHQPPAPAAGKAKRR